MSRAGRSERNFTPFVYAVDARAEATCEMAGCEEPLAYCVLMRLSTHEVDVGLCVPHFVKLREWVTHPHGED